jgi:UDP-N-acetylmuramoyl-L-alanyl-D-glutamate--2,6-diaminopimelate ligase
MSTQVLPAIASRPTASSPVSRTIFEQSALGRLLAGTEVLLVEGMLPQQITGVVCDSRRVRPGNVFVAINGTATDGHRFVEQAFERGATAVVCERRLQISPYIAEVVVGDAREALAVAAANFFGRPADTLRMVGITGTNGKTTTAFMTRQILETAGVNTGLIGTVHYQIKDRIITAGRTTPESVEIHEMLAGMKRHDCEACVMEVSSHALALKRVHGIDYDVAVFTNLTQDHLDFHGDMDSYFRAKSLLFKTLGEGKKKARAVINIDDRHGEILTASIGGVLKAAGDAWCVGIECYTYGLSDRAVIRAVDIETTRQGYRFVVVTPQGRAKIVLPLFGKHNIYNALAAIGVGIALEVDISTIARALKRMPQVPGRLEAVDCGQSFKVFVDYAHTDDALRNVLTALNELPHNRIITVFGCGGNRDAGKRPKMGRVASELSDFCILTSDNPRKEDPRSILAQIQQGMTEKGDYEIVVDRRTAIARALGMAQSGDIVLIAGKGHESYQEFSDIIAPFDDREVAREFLRERRRPWWRCAWNK